MTGKKDLARLRKRRRRKQRIIRTTVHLFVWLGAAVLYYIGFSLFFDTPLEYEMKHSTDRLRSEYAALTQRYDSLQTVMENLAARDRSVFRILFESDPYDFDSEYERQQSLTYEKIVDRSTRRLKRELRDRVADMERRLGQLNDTYLALQERIDSAGRDCDRIPSIQPVINKQLTLLTASYGMRIHPFYKTLQSHQGVDYTIPEGSRVFATADGVVRDVATRNSTQGRTVVIAHGNGYETSYSHLSRINVRRGQQVRRGDIIALSGDTGLSLSPHLHYEVRYNGMRVDPVHYFFMELSPSEYQRLIRIAQSGMQAFDCPPRHDRFPDQTSAARLRRHAGRHAARQHARLCRNAARSGLRPDRGGVCGPLFRDALRGVPHADRRRRSRGTRAAAAAQDRALSPLFRHRAAQPAAMGILPAVPRARGPRVDRLDGQPRQHRERHASSGHRRSRRRTG